MNVKKTDAKASKKKRVMMTYEAPGAQSVVVTGSFCDWAPKKHVLKNDGNGVWKKTLTLSPGDYEYRFIVDGQWHNDPACSTRVTNAFGTENCFLHI